LRKGLAVSQTDLPLWRLKTAKFVLGLIEEAFTSIMNATNMLAHFSDDGSSYSETSVNI
jgi:hypothetical protein